VGKILRWVPFGMEEKELINMLRNKMIRPTTIPQTLKELIIEHAVAREAIRLGFEHHKTIATRLRGVKVERALADIFEQSLAETYIEMIKIGIIVGTGGLLSHAPRRAQSLMILMDAFQPVGVTRMFQDSVFMMPHLGVLSTVYPEAAWQIFDKDCLLRLGTVIAPLGEAKDGEKVMEVRLETPNEESETRQINFGEILSISLGEGKEADIIISPAKEFDIGAGRGKALETKVKGGVVGVVLDARGRPMNLPEEKRKETLLRWISSLSLYPDAQMRDLAEA